MTYIKNNLGYQYTLNDRLSLPQHMSKTLAVMPMVLSAAGNCQNKKNKNIFKDIYKYFLLHITIFKYVKVYEH